MSDPVDGVPETPLAENRTTVTARSVMTSAVWITTASLLSIPLLAVTTILLAHILGASGFGKVAVYTLLFSLLGGITDLGLGSTILRRGAVAAGEADERGVLAAVRAGTTWSLAQVPWTILVAFLVLPTTTSALLYCIAVVLTLCFLGPSHYLVMTSQMRIPSVIRLGSVVLSSAATLATAVVTHRPDLTFSVAGIGGSLLTFAQVAGVPAASRRTVFRPGRIRFSRTDIGFGIGNLVNGQLNNLVFSKSEILFFSPAQSADRGRFAAAQTIAGRSTLLVDALLGNLAIAMASALGRGAEVMRRSFRLASESVSLLFIVLAPLTLAAVALLTGPVLGQGYQGLAGAATALAAMSLLQSSATPLLAIRFAQKTIGPLIAAGAAAAVVDLGIAALLVRHHGVVGAVIANVAGSAIYLGVTVALFTRQTGVRDLAIVHAVKLTALVAYASVLPVLLMALPRTVGLWLGLPLALAWTVIALRLPGLRVSDRVISELATDVLPRRVGRLLLVPWVRRLLAGR